MVCDLDEDVELRRRDFVPIVGALDVLFLRDFDCASSPGAFIPFICDIDFDDEPAIVPRRR